MTSCATRILLILAVLVSGPLAGGDSDRAFAATPAWTEAGAIAWDYGKMMRVAKFRLRPKAMKLEIAHRVAAIACSPARRLIYVIARIGFFGM